VHETIKDAQDNLAMHWRGTTLLYPCSARCN